MTFAESLQYLYGLGHETTAMKFGLRSTETLLAAFGNPQRNYLKIQIAGTNGKGSTARFLDSICAAANIKTGLFTSPHLVSITERIEIDKFQISNFKFAELTDKVKQTAEKLVVSGELETVPTFFEHLTVIALLAFAEENVELAILETGLGGRLDSTTAARAEIVAITPLSLDHQEYLGNTLAEIAREKAAIIRPDVRAVVVAAQEPGAMRVIQGKCRECGVEPTMAATATKIQRIEPLGRLQVSFDTGNNSYPNILLGLLGRHQIENAATAIGLVEALRESGYNIAAEQIWLGLETAAHAGRLQYFSHGESHFLFDGAHNIAGARALREYLDEFVKTKITVVFGAMRDKELNEIAALLFPAANRLVLTRPGNQRSAELELLKNLALEYLDENFVYLAPTVQEALRTAQTVTSKNDLICVTGSLYLVGEAQGILLG